MKNRGRMYQACVVALAVGLLAGGCGKKEHDVPAAAAKKPTVPVPTKVTLATSKNLWCTLPLVASANGYFAKEGLAVDMQYLQSGRYCLDAVISGSAEFGTIVEVNIGFVAYTGNDTVSTVATIVKSSAGSAMVARKSAGISKPEDLRGKKVALCPGTTSDVFANKFLQKYGLTPKDVEIVKVQPLALQSTMVAKGADAASAWQPFVHNIKKMLGDDATVLSDPSVYTGYELVAVRSEWARQNRATVMALLRALRAAEMFVKEHPEDAQAIVGKACDLDTETVKAIWAEHEINLVMDATEMTAAVTSVGTWIRETQPDYLAKPLPDYARYFDASYMKALSNEPRP